MAIKHVTMKQVTRLSEHFRQYTSIEWSIDWKELGMREKKDWHRSGRDYFWVLALGGFHSRGYYHQVCLGEIADYPNMFPFLILRPNDQVEQMRLATARAVLTRLEICPLDESFIVMTALGRIRRSGGEDGRTADALPTFHGND